MRFSFINKREFIWKKVWCISNIWYKTSYRCTVGIKEGYATGYFWSWNKRRKAKDWYVR